MNNNDALRAGIALSEGENIVAAVSGRFVEEVGDTPVVRTGNLVVSNKRVYCLYSKLGVGDYRPISYRQIASFSSMPGNLGSTLRILTVDEHVIQLRWIIDQDDLQQVELAMRERLNSGI